MATRKSDIIYYDRKGDLPDDFDFVVSIDPGFDDKREFLESLARALDFPDYFGKNWDAFSDCMNDLSWLDTRRLLLIHEDVPLETRPADASSYLDILIEARQSWAVDDALELALAFPASCRDRIATLTDDLA